MKASGRTLLDTSVVVALLRNEPTVVERFREDREFFLSAIAAGELIYGAHKAARFQENLETLERFFRAGTILPVTAETAKVYGAIKNALRQEGRLIPENDLWIAAVAKQHQLVLAARDAHFENIAGIAYEAW